MAERMIRVLMVEPGEPPHAVWIPLTHDSLSNAVKNGADDLGNARIRKVEPGVYVLYNDGGILSDLPGNRHVGTMVICGVFYVIAADEQGYIKSLPDSILRRYQKLLWDPEEIPYRELVQAHMSDFLRQLDEIEFSDSTDIYY